MVGWGVGGGGWGLGWVGGMREVGSCVGREGEGRHDPHEPHLLGLLMLLQFIIACAQSKEDA